MKQNDIFTKPMLVLLAIIVLACNAGGIITPVSTNPSEATPTQKATNTATPKPTSKPRPTATKITPTPIPIPMGTPVSNEDYEVNVLYMRTLDTVYLDAEYHWVPTAGNMFVELGIKVVNLNPRATGAVRWGDIYVLEVDEHAGPWYPNWGESKSVASDVTVNPKSLVFKSLEDKASEQIIFKDVVFVRAIYTVRKHSPTTLLFGFDSSPLIQVIVP
jgi:hypothetical protein